MEEKKKLGRFDIFSIGVGSAIGSGIFVMLGMGIAHTGHSAALAIAVGCLYMTLAYLYHPVMASMFVLPGGDYDCKTMLFSPLLTGASGIMMFVQGFGLAIYPLAIVDYASMIFPILGQYRTVVAALILILFFAATIKGSKFVATLNSIMTVVLLCAIGLFIIMGLPKVQSGFLDGKTFFLNGPTGFLMAIAMMSFACSGITRNPVAMMSVTKNARKTIPTMILWITLAVGVLYGLMGVVASGVLPVEEVANQSLAVVAAQIFPHWVYVVFVIGGACFAIATSLVSGLAGLRYPAMRTAEDGWLPAVFKKTTKGGFPYVIQGVFFLAGLLPILFNFSLDTIVSLVQIPMMLMNLALNLALIGLVKKYPEQWESSIFHMPMPAFIILCVVASLCSALVALMLFVSLGTTSMILCVVFIAICFVLAFVRLKTGAVSKEALQAKREEIAAKALAMTKAEK